MPCITMPCCAMPETLDHEGTRIFQGMFFSVQKGKIAWEVEEATPQRRLGAPQGPGPGS